MQWVLVVQLIIFVKYYGFMCTLHTSVPVCMSSGNIGQHIGKAPSLHLFHATVRQCMEVFLKHTTGSQPSLAVHGCSLFLRLLPPPTWSGNKARMTFLVVLCYTEPLQNLSSQLEQTADQPRSQAHLTWSNKACWQFSYGSQKLIPAKLNRIAENTSLIGSGM